MRYLFVLVFFLISLYGSVATVFAQENITSYEKVILERNQTIQKDYFAKGESVTLSGTVNGDAYLGGGTILVDGKVNGDLFVGGGNVTIRGNVANDVRIAGGNITIAAVIGGNVTTLGGNVNITDTARIAGSLTATSGNLELFAPLGKGATLAVDSATLGSTIAGDVTAATGKLTLTESARINGNLTYWSDKRASIAQGANVSGRVTQNMFAEKRDKDAAKFFTGFGIAFLVLDALATLVSGLILLYLVPVYLQNTADDIRKNLWRNLFIGFGAALMGERYYYLLLRDKKTHLIDKTRSGLKTHYFMLSFRPSSAWEKSHRRS